MGLGKALQAWPAFVVAPSALRWSHRARESSVMVRSRDGCSMHIASWLQWWSMLYLAKPWLDDVQVRRFLVSRTRLRGDRFLSRGEAPSVLGCPSWKRMPLFDEALARGQSEVTPDCQVSRTEASVPRLWPELRGQLDEPPELVSSTDSNSV